jgi:hypothetical protein
MAKIKLSAYKSTGDRAPNKPIPKVSTTIKRVSTVSKPSKKKSDDPSSDEDTYMASASPFSNIDSSQGSIVVPTTIRTRSGQTPQEEQHEVSRSYVY